MSEPPRNTLGSVTHEFIERVQKWDPSQVLRISDEVNPADFGVTGVLGALEAEGRSPMVLFENPLTVNGEPSPIPVLTNVFASRERCAIAQGLDPSAAGLDLSLDFSSRERGALDPVIVPPEQAPVRQVELIGEDADLGDLPVVRFHKMDPGPYIDMVCVMKNPEKDSYNSAFLRNMLQGPRQVGIHMSPRHNWRFCRTNERENRPTPVAIVVSHDPSFYLGALNVRPYGDNDYEVIGSIMGEPLRLTPSATLGDDFMIPADADIVVEGRVLPNKRQVEAPFGEFPGYYGPQRRNWVIEVSGIVRREKPVFQAIFVGHKDNWVLGSIPKEGALFSRIRGVVPGVTAVHLPDSGCGRFHCYISIDKRVDGESRQAALIALGEIDFVKHVVVVDADIDVFQEEQVVWAIATRIQASRDIDIIKNAKGNTLDPSQIDDIMTDKLIIDATKPVSRPFAKRVEVPEEALTKGRAILESLK